MRPVMRPLRYSINVTLDGCCDHRVMISDQELHRRAVESLDQVDGLLFGRVTYEMNAELVRGDLGEAVQQLKREPGKGLLVRRRRRRAANRSARGGRH